MLVVESFAPSTSKERTAPHACALKLATRFLLFPQCAAGLEHASARCWRDSGPRRFAAAQTANARPAMRDCTALPQPALGPPPLFLLAARPPPRCGPLPVP